MDRLSTHEPTGAMAGEGQSLPDQAKNQMREVTHQAKEKAGTLAEQAKTQVKSQLTSQKDRAAEGLGGMAEALRQTGDQLKQQETPVPIGQYADRAAEMVDQVAGYLRTKDIDQIVGQVEDLARQRPAVFLGSAFVLGFMATRFLRSSAPSGGGNGQHQGSGMGQARFDAPYYRERETIREGELHEREGYPVKSAYQRTEELRASRGMADTGTGAIGGTSDFPSTNLNDEDTTSDFAQSSQTRSSDV